MPECVKPSQSHTSMCSWCGRKFATPCMVSEAQRRLIAAFAAKAGKNWRNQLLKTWRKGDCDAELRALRPLMREHRLYDLTNIEVLKWQAPVYTTLVHTPNHNMLDWFLMSWEQPSLRMSNGKPYTNTLKRLLATILQEELTRTTGWTRLGAIDRVKMFVLHLWSHQSNEPAVQGPYETKWFRVERHHPEQLLTAGSKHTAAYDIIRPELPNASFDLCTQGLAVHGLLNRPEFYFKLAWVLKETKNVDGSKS